MSSLRMILRQKPLQRPIQQHYLIPMNMCASTRKGYFIEFVVVMCASGDTCSLLKRKQVQEFILNLRMGSGTGAVLLDQWKEDIPSIRYVQKSSIEIENAIHLRITHPGLH
jgi:hypothetical protein